MGVAFLLPAPFSPPRSLSLLKEAGEDVEETLVDSSAPSSLFSSFLTRVLLTLFRLRALLHRSLQLHLQNRRTPVSRRSTQRKPSTRAKVA